MTDAARRPLRHRARAVPPREAHHRLGREHPRHQRPPLAVHRRSAPQRREVLHHRSAPEPHRQAADRHYAIHPGTDAALALAMMHVILSRRSRRPRLCRAAHARCSTNLTERVRAWTPQRAAELTGIAAEDIVDLAREYATTRPAAIRLNYGVQRSERGAMAVRTIALLPALTGAWRDIGGGSNSPLRRPFSSTARLWNAPICKLARRSAAKPALSI